MNKQLLKSKMALHSDNLMTLSAAIGISYTTLSKKMNSENEFTQKEISEIRNRYSLSNEEVIDIFFADYVS